jgi:O-antigen/teichoic acid export membrane protein
VASHRAVGADERARYLIRHALAHLAVVALLVSFLYTLTIPLLTNVLDLQAPGPAIALIPVIGLSFVVPVILGALQGMERFLAFGVMSLAIATARVAFGVPWVEAGGGSGGAIAGQGIGMLVVALVAVWMLRGHYAGRGAGAATSGLRRVPDVRSVTASAAFIGFALLSNLDVLLAKLFLPAHEVGIYAALATVGKVVIFLPAAVAVVLVPNAARARPGSRDRIRVLRIAAVLVLGAAAVFAVPAAVAPELVIRSMFGARYLAATDGVLPIVCAGAGLAFLYLLVVYSVTVQDRRWTWLLVFGVAFQIAAISAFHDSPQQIAAAQAVVVLTVLTLNELAFHSILKPVGRRRDVHD